MHHKRRRSKARRAGCLMCKPWKAIGHNRNRKRSSALVRPLDHRLRLRAEDADL